MDLCSVLHGVALGPLRLSPAKLAFNPQIDDNCGHCTLAAR